MIQGRFENTSGRPYIEAHLTIPSLNLDGMISFILDTGADCTVLMPSDATRLQVDYSKLTDRYESIGAGGKSNDYPVAAILMIPDGRVVHAYEIDLLIAEPKPDLSTVPSILGRDVIDRWCLTYDPSSKKLTAKVRSSDKQFPIS